MPNKLTQEEFIKRSVKIHGNKYDYSKIKFIDTKTKIKIICKEHGIFEQIPSSHLLGAGCQKCYFVGRTLTQEDVIKRAKQVHGDKYDYSLVKYINSYTKIKIICKKHGLFKQSPNSHLMGCGCVKCSYDNMRCTQEDILKKIKSIHGDRYDYSLMKYIDAGIKVKIICKEHGVFEQLLGVHYNGSGCIKCFGNKKLKKEQILKILKNVHGDKYDYSLLEPNGVSNKIKIICKNHGVFEQILMNHMLGQGCSKCSRLINAKKATSTTDEFIKKAKKTHNNKYGYSLVLYKKNDIKVKILCKTHGVFEQTPNLHLNGAGCPMCSGTKKLTTETFIHKAIKIHGDEYDYSLVDYANSHTKIKITCKVHGAFEQMPYSHLNKRRCPKCSDTQKTTEVFIREARIIHGDIYDYSLVDYKNANTKVKIICKKHGEFEQGPSHHLANSGCPHCKLSKGEKFIFSLLKNGKISFDTQKKFEGCKFKNILPFDFFLVDFNCCLEFHGDQHFYPYNHFGGINKLKYRKKLDSIKENYCKINKIHMIIVFKRNYYSKNYKFIDLYNNSNKKIIKFFLKNKFVQVTNKEYIRFKKESELIND